MQPVSGNQHPHLLTSLMNMSLVLRLPQKMYLCRSSSTVPRLPSVLEMLQNPQVLLTFDKVHNPLRLPRKTTLQRPKVARACGVLYLLTSKYALRHSGVHFFDIATSKSALNPSVMSFAPQRRAIFISHLASWLRTRRLREPTFRPSGATNHLKNTGLRDFPTFSHTCIFFLLTLSLFDLLSSSLLFSDSSHLCFSSVHIVGSLTSKLPSIIFYIHFHKCVCNYTLDSLSASFTSQDRPESLKLLSNRHNLLHSCAWPASAAESVIVAIQWAEKKTQSELGSLSIVP